MSFQLPRLNYDNVPTNAESTPTPTPIPTRRWRWLFSTPFCAMLALVLSIVLALEITSAATAKRNLFELVIANQVFGDLCLPVDETQSWSPMTSVAGAFTRLLDGASTGAEPLFGHTGSFSAIALLNAAGARGLSLMPGASWENFMTLESQDEFRLSRKYSTELWGQLEAVLSKCSRIYSTGNVIFTSLLNATPTIMNRNIETKNESIPDWLWNEKVVLRDDYACPSDYGNVPRTLLNYEDLHDRSLRDRFKQAYIEGLYKAPYTADALATTINDIVFTVLTEHPLPAVENESTSYVFDEPRSECPQELRGVLCSLFVAYFDATLTTHAGAAQIGGSRVELTTAMIKWLYQGFHVGFFSKNETANAMTSDAAETILCFYAKAAKDGLAANDNSAIQTRWLQAVAGRNDPALTAVFGPDACAVESLHNNLALAQQIAVASSHVMLQLWVEVQKKTIQPGELACNPEKRRKFLRESLRFSSPGVPTMFSRGMPGQHDFLSGDGSRKVTIKGGKDAVDLIAHSIPSRHTLSFDESNKFDMDRPELACPFLKQRAYQPSLQLGGAGRDITADADYDAAKIVFGGTGDVDGSHHEYCHSDENNVFLNSASAADDLLYWMTSNKAYAPFGLGYRRCPGESLVWRTLDQFVERLDRDFDLSVTHPIEDSAIVRFALGKVPSNGLRVRLTATNRSNC